MIQFKDLKHKLQSSKKLMSGFIAGIIVIIGLIIGGVTFLNMPKSVMSDVNVSFYGYDKQGEATLSGDYKTKIASIIGKKYKNVSDLIRYTKDTSVSLNKDSDLSNGDEVTVKIATSLKGNPIKLETKKFKVKGLKKSKTYTLASLLKDKPIKFVGFNKSGAVDPDIDDMYRVSTASSSDGSSTGSFSNGDKVVVSLSSLYIEEQKNKGNILVGEDSTTVKVSGLKDSIQSSAVTELLAQIDTDARSANKGSSYSSYTVTRQETYFIGKNVSNSFWGSSKFKPGQFSVIAIYKVEEVLKDSSSASKPDTSYKIYGYSGLTLSGDKVDMSSINSDNKYSDSGYYTVQEASDRIKSDHATAVKIN